MVGKTPLYGYTNQDRYKKFRELLLKALEKGPRTQFDLGMAMGFRSTSFLTTIHRQAISKSNKISQTAKVVRNLLDLEIISITKTSHKFKIWELMKQEQKVIPQRVVTVEPSTSKEAFEVFMRAVKLDAERASQHKINSLKAACEGYVKLIKEMQETRREQANVEQLFNFKSL